MVVAAADVTDDLPEHASQAADTSITSETTYPIPSFPSFQLPFSFPSQPLSDHSIISAQGHNFSYSGELPGSQIDEAQLVSEMSRRYLRSLSPNPIPEDSQQSASQRSDNYGRLPEGKLRSISPFVPPTQAHPTQAQPTPSSSAPRSAQAGSSQSRAARSPSPTHASQTSSVEVGRGNTSIELQYSPPDVVSDMAPPPAVSTITAPRTPREFVFRREPANRSLGFGSAASLSSDSPKAGESPQARKGRLVSESVTGSGGVRNSRLSVGFTFGSGLGGSNGSEHRPSEP